MILPVGAEPRLGLHPAKDRRALLRNRPLRPGSPDLRPGPEPGFQAPGRRREGFMEAGHPPADDHGKALGHDIRTDETRIVRGWTQNPRVKRMILK